MVHIMPLPFANSSLYSVPEITPDIRKSSSKITIHDNKTIYIENYKCIISCSETEIFIKTNKNIICINGNCLKIDYYCPEEIKLSGLVKSVVYQ